MALCQTFMAPIVDDDPSTYKNNRAQLWDDTQFVRCFSHSNLHFWWGFPHNFLWFSRWHVHFSWEIPRTTAGPSEPSARRLSHVDAIAFVHGGLRSAQLRGLRKAAEEAGLPWPIYGSYDVIFLSMIYIMEKISSIFILCIMEYGLRISLDDIILV